MNSEIALQMCTSTLWAYTQREACCSAPPTEFQSCMKTIFTMPHLKFGQANKPVSSTTSRGCCCVVQKTKLNDVCNGM